MNTISTSYATITFYTENQELSVRSSIINDSNLTNDLVSLSTKRDLSTDNPVFEINLVHRKPYMDYIRPNDLVKIELSRAGIGSKTVMYGLVDDIRENLTPMSANITVIGRGFSKALSNFEIGVLTSLEQSMNVMNPAYRIIGQVPSGTISGDTIIRELFYKLFLDHEDYQFSNGETYASIVRTQLSSDQDAIMPKTLHYQNYNGNLWNLFKELKSEPFHELYWEIIDDRPTMIFRKTPFDSEDWNLLPTHTIQNIEDILSYNIGISDVETYTVYQVQYNGNEIPLDRSTTEITSAPIYNSEYYKKYGLKALQVSSPYLRMFSISDNKVNLLEKWQRRLYDWYIKNNSYKNGSITIIGNPNIQIGTRLLVFDTEFYIEGVTHQFQSGKSYTTELQLTRGMNSVDRFLSPVGQYEKYTADRILGEQTYTEGDNQLKNDNGTFISPVSLTTVTSPFGNRIHPVYKTKKMHTGVDLRANFIKVRASRSGKVTSANTQSGYGKVMVIQHDNGYETRYAHLSEFITKVGQSVNQGELIAVSGNSGTTTAPHLHFEIRHNGTPVDPMKYI